MYSTHYILNIFSKTTDESSCEKIIESLGELGINESNFTVGTNHVYALANWNDAELSEKLKKIKEIPNVEYIEVSRAPKLIVRSIVDNVPISERLSASILKDPIKEIKNAQDERDYFKALSYSCTIFEYYGIRILRQHFHRNGTPVKPKKLEHLNLMSIIIMLYTNKIIKEGAYSDMFKVRDLRNRFVHNDYSIAIPTDILNEAEGCTVQALECVSLLKHKYDNMVNVP